MSEEEDVALVDGSPTGGENSGKVDPGVVLLHLPALLQPWLHHLVTDITPWLRCKKVLGRKWLPDDSGELILIVFVHFVTEGSPKTLHRPTKKVSGSNIARILTMLLVGNKVYPTTKPAQKMSAFTCLRGMTSRVCEQWQTILTIAQNCGCHQLARGIVGQFGRFPKVLNFSTWTESYAKQTANTVDFAKIDICIFYTSTLLCSASRHVNALN